MKATIVNYVNREHQECYSIGNSAMIEEIKKKSLQIIRTMEVEVSEQKRYELGDYTQDELIQVMIDTMDGELSVFYLN